MKKFLLPIFCAMMALTSCLKESTFTVNNYTDYVTCYQGSLVTDNGSVLNVVENQSGNETWRTEGSRFYILCDILNRQLDIRLKDIYTVRIMEPFAFSQMEKEYDDPVEVLESSLSGGYLNLGVKYYYNPSSNYARHFESYWEEDGNSARLYFFLDGNHESPEYMDAEQLKQKEEVFSISLKQIIDAPREFSSLVVILYELDDKNIAVKKTYTLYVTL